MRTRTTARSIAATGAALLALTACGGGGDEGGDDTAATPAAKRSRSTSTAPTATWATPSVRTSSEDGALAGMKGTTPLTELSAGLHATGSWRSTPTSQDYNYAGETYDAVVISALAAQMAGTNDANVFKAYVNGVTFGGDKCDDFATCLEIINGGGNPDYDGVSGPLAFTDAGEPAAASFGILQFGADNALDNDATEYVIAGDEENAATDEGPAPAAAGATGGPLIIGTLLPLTGSLAFLGPPEVAGLQLADRRHQRGRWRAGRPGRAARGSTRATPRPTPRRRPSTACSRPASTSIVGAASSGVSQTVIDTITGAGIMQISPANTSDIFTTYDDNGLYFRTAPPDLLQARALADLIIEDGNNTVGILALNDPYGTGLAENTPNNLVDGGLSEEDVVEQVIYDPQAANFDAEVQQMVDLNPDAIVVIGFEESVADHLSAQRAGHRPAALITRRVD